MQRAGLTLAFDCPGLFISTPMSLAHGLAKVSKLPKAQRSTVVLAVAVLLVLRTRLLQLPREVVTGVFDRTSSKDKIPEDVIGRAEVWKVLMVELSEMKVVPVYIVLERH